MRERKSRVVALQALVIASLLLLLIPQASATVVFTEDFNDGVMDWTVPNGNFSIYEYASSDYAIRSGTTGSSDHESEQWCWKATPEMSSGTWSFDAFYPYVVGFSWMNLYFFLNGSLDAGPWYGNDFYGYFLRIEIEDPDVATAVSLRRVNDSDYLYIGFGMFEAPCCGTWTHFDVTRNSSTGETNVFVNGTHLIQGYDTTFTHSEKFCFYVEKFGFVAVAGAMLDNVVISDDITIHPPSNTTTTTTTSEEGTTTTTESDTGTLMLLLAVGGGVAVLLVIVLVLKRR